MLQTILTSMQSGIQAEIYLKSVLIHFCTGGHYDVISVSVATDITHYRLAPTDVN